MDDEYDDNDPDEFDNVPVEFVDSFVVDCQTLTGASEFIDWILSGVTTETAKDLESVVRVFFDIRTKDVRQIRGLVREHPAVKKGKHRKQKGGFQYESDFRITSMLALADTHHDFRKVSLAFLDDKLAETPLPKGITLETLKKESSLVRKLASMRSLILRPSLVANRGVKVANPLYGAKFLDVFDLDKFIKKANEADRNVKGLYRAQMRHADGKYDSDLVHVDITTVTDARESSSAAEKKLALIKLRQVASVIATMRRLYGSKDYVVDADSGWPMIKLLFAYKNIDEAFFLKFKTFPKAPSIALLSKAILALVEIRLVGDYEPLGRLQQTDAAIFDPAINSERLELDSSATGRIYGEGAFDFQVRLDGCRQTKEGTKVDIVISEQDRTIELSLTSKQCANYVSKNSITSYMLVGASRGNKADPIDAKLSTLSRETLFALKRAGDWGQVEHCKTYSKVFVTRDRLAALYAHYRDVKYVFLSFDDRTSSLPAPWLPLISRYSFVMKR